MTDIIVPALLFTMIAAIVLGTTFFSHQTRIRKYRIIEKMIDQGQTVSPELLESLGKSGSFEKGGNTAFGHAVFQILTGIGLSVFFWAMHVSVGVPSFLIAIGVFPFVNGLARLLAILYENRLPN